MSLGPNELSIVENNSNELSSHFDICPADPGQCGADHTGRDGGGAVAVRDVEGNLHPRRPRLLRGHSFPCCMVGKP